MTHTCLGTSIWDWEPWVELELPSRNLWLAFYTSVEAKRLMPGLWHGGVSSMAEASRMDGHLTATALQDLIDRGMFEFDKKSRVGRITAAEGFNAFPDTSEFPTNGNTIRGWYNRFLSVPDVPIRNAHVTTLQWLVSQGCLEHGQKKGKPPSHDHAQAWQDTFGTVQIPSHNRRRGTRRVLDEDTSTSVQSSLFGILEPPAVDKSSLSEIRYPGLVHTLPSDQNSMISVSGEGFPKPRSEAEAKAEGSLLSSGEQGEPPIDRDHAPRPRLALVPSPGPFTVDELVAVFGERHVPWPPGLQENLASAISRLPAGSVGPDDLGLLREAIAAGVMPEVIADLPEGGARRHVGWERVVAMADPHVLLASLGKARERRTRVEEQRRAFAEIREKAGI